MSRRDFTEALREAERARADQTLSPFAERRIQRAIESDVHGARREAGHRWFLPLAIGAAAAAAAVTLVVSVTRTDAPAGPAIAFAEDGTATFERPDTELKDARHRVSVVGQPGAKVAQAPQGLRMVEGIAEFDVEHRTSGEPSFVVFVSHGHIEVLGTRFTVIQRAEGGEVTLHEGHIRFIDPTGRSEDLSAGGKLSWPLPAETAAAAPIAPAPPANIAEVPGRTFRPTRFDVEAFIDELSVLRRRGQFGEAARRLEGALGQSSLAADTRERLSYELGSILTWQLRDVRQACKVWKTHKVAHPGGRYADEVERAEATLGCP